MKVIKNYLYNAGYQILLMLAPVLTTPYISRVLGAHNNGINTYTNGWVTFFYLLGQLGVMLYGNRQIAYERDNKYQRSKIFFGIVSLQIMTSFTALVAYLIAVFLFSSAFKEYFLLQALWIVAYGIDISWYFMGMEDFKKTVTRNTIVKLITIALIFILVRNYNDLSKYIFLLGLAQLAGSITLWPYLKKSIQWVKIREWHPFKHFYPTLLLFIPTITTQIYLVVNRIMLGRMAPQAAVSQFNFGDNIVKLVLAIVTATGTVMLPHIANKFACDSFCYSTCQLNYIIPMPAPPAGIAGVSSLMFATADSVVRSVDATDVAFWRALLVTLTGSRIPLATMSTYSSVAALKPIPASDSFTLLIITAPSSPAFAAI